MIFVDSSALVAMLAGEPDAATFAEKLAADGLRISAGHVILESSMRLATLLDVPPTGADALVTRLLREAESEIVPINEETARGAVAALERYGKGRRNRAGMNFGDCLSYACTQTHNARLLFKGADFAQTDIAIA